ncbi:MAG: response regulator transcription factor [Polyangiaceae bacterium]|nr:response regulator transcription factor [Polyangiaceae bacterium]
MSSRLPSERRPRFLLADDDELITRSVTRVLRLARPRWEVTTVATASEGARVLERIGFDMVVVDLALPGLPGTALLEFARVRHPTVARVVFSVLADGAEHHPEVCAAHSVLVKPTTAEELVSALASALRQNASERVLARTARLAPARLTG